MNTDSPTLEGLERQVAALSDARSPSEVFKLLLEGTRLAAARGAIFLVRQGQVKGWGCVGYEAEAVQRQRSYSAAVASGWLGKVATSTATSPELRTAPLLDPDFGQTPADESMALTIRIRQRPIAVLLAERSTEADPWSVALLSVLVRTAQLRLELNLAAKKLGKVAQPGPQPGARPATPAPAREAASASPTPDGPEMEAVRRYAKLVATDIRLYNEEAVMLGRQNGDLVERLGDQLDRGRQTFMRRHGDMGSGGLEILHQAYIEVLAGGEEKLLPASVLG